MHERIKIHTLYPLPTKDHRRKSKDGWEMVKKYCWSLAAFPVAAKEKNFRNFILASFFLSTLKYFASFCYGTRFFILILGKYFFKIWSETGIFTIYVIFSEDAGKPDQSMSVKCSGPGNVFFFGSDKKDDHQAGKCAVKRH